MHADITGVSRKESKYAPESSPTPDEFREQLDRILNFAELENSPRLQAFLNMAWKKPSLVAPIA